MSVMLPQSPQSPPNVSQPTREPSRQNERETPERVRDRRLVVGTILVLFGVVMLIETLTTWSLLATFVIPALGLFFAAWGCATRRAGLIIPGGILLGAGTGAALAAQSFTPAGGTDQGAIVVLCLALGFAVITPLTWAFTERMHWWPLIPGGVLAFVGISLLGGDWGMQALIWLGRLWPIVLIITGAVLLWHVARKR